MQNYKEYTVRIYHDGYDENGNFQKYYGLEEWTHNGKFHRLDGPSKILDGKSFWYKNNKLHRDGDLPAVYNADKSHVEYYTEGQLHRENMMPARIEYRGDGSIVNEYYTEGKLHRLNGPAVEIKDCTNEYEKNIYYVDGVSYKNAEDYHAAVADFLQFKNKKSGDIIEIDGKRYKRI